MEAPMKVMADKLYGDKWLYTQDDNPDQYEYNFMQVRCMLRREVVGFVGAK